jgi:hypothetical protein
MATIRQTAYCIDLARCLYYLSAPYHGVAVRDFDTLNGIDKQPWIDEAEAAFDAVAPLVQRTPTRPDYFDLAASLAHKEAGKVLARISPQSPWGDPVMEPRD